MQTMAENGTQTKERTPAQRRLLAALLVSRNVREACKAAGIAERTAYSWLADSQFAAALAALEGQAIDEAARRLVQLTGSALDVLEAVLSDEAAPRSVRVRAAVAVLDELLKLRELRNVEARLAALEAAYAAHR